MIHRNNLLARCATAVRQMSNVADGSTAPEIRCSGLVCLCPKKLPLWRTWLTSHLRQEQTTRSWNALKITIAAQERPSHSQLVKPEYIKFRSD